MSDPQSTAILSDEQKRQRLEELVLTPEQVRISGLIGAHCAFENIKLGISNLVANQDDLKLLIGLVGHEQADIEKVLELWARNASLVEVAALYFHSFHHNLSMENIGYDFAAFLCRVRGAEEIFQKLILELHECEERFALEAVAAELSERGGG